MAVENDAEFPVGRAFALQDKVRTHLATPLSREGIVLGVILIRRTEVRPFSEAHISLLQTFADQAVIAIENVRLFKELQQKNQALTVAHAQVTESLEQQTATAEILSVISGSPTDIHRYSLRYWTARSRCARQATDQSTSSKMGCFATWACG